MKARLFAALLATTAFVSPAQALPAVGFALGAFAPGAASLIGGIGLNTALAGGFYAGVGFSTTFLGGAAALGVRAAVSFGLSKLADNLTRSNSNPAAAAQSVNRLANYAQPITPVEYVFGQVRKGGPLGFTGFADNKRFYAPILAAHRCHGVSRHWLDESPVSVSGSSVVSGLPSGYGTIVFYRGTAGQTSNTALRTNFSEVTTAMNFKSLCYAVCSAARPAPEAFSEVYPTGREWTYAPVIYGWDEIYDPRTDSTGYSNNAALVIAKWATDILGALVDWDEVAIEADKSDILVTNKDGDTQPKWTLNCILTDDQSYETQREQLAIACDAFFYERADGGIGFKVGGWEEPTVTLYASDFYELEDSRGSWGTDEPNEVAIEYVEPVNKWQETVSGAWVEDATSKKNREVLQAYAINSHNQALRVAKRVSKVSHAESKITGTLGLIGAELLGQRFFRLVHDEAGISETFEIGELQRSGNVWSVSAVRSSEADFNFNAATEEPDKNEYSSVISTDTVADVVGLTALAANGGAVDVDWTEADESLNQQLQVCDNLGGNCQIISVPGGQRPYRITGLVDGDTYRIKARNRTIAGRVSDWAPSTAVEITAVFDATPPGLVSGVSLSESSGDVGVNFTSPNDANFSGVRIYRADYAAAYAGPFAFGDASLIATEYGGANVGHSYTDAAPGIGVHAYWIKSINSSGTESAETAAQTIEII